MQRRTMLGTTAAAAIALGSGARAAGYPERPITLICPWGAGGGTDATARIVASILERDLGVPVNVVNRTGGSGVVGHSAIATAAPDGYTLGIITVEIGMMHWQGLTELTYKDYTPLALMNEDPAGLQVRAEAPLRRWPRRCSTPCAAATRVPAEGVRHRARAASGIWRWPACCRPAAWRPTRCNGCRARVPRPACRIWWRAGSRWSPARCRRRSR